MAGRSLTLALLAFQSNDVVSLRVSEGNSRANPIRRVVTMLQMMQKKVESEGETEEELYKKYLCYCKTGGQTLEQSIQDAETKIPQLESELDGAAQIIVQLKADIPAEKKERDGAKAAMAEAKSIRENEAVAFAKESTDLKANMEAMTKALTALESGVAGGFLQTPSADRLRNVVSHSEMDDDDKDVVASFLSATSGSSYAPQSGQIVGILKQMKDTMEGNLKDATEAENAAIADYEKLVDAKTKEVNALQKSIEEKMTRLGKMGVNQVNMADDLEATKESLVEDKKFLADLDKNCATKEAEWEERQKTRAEELLALADTIKVLNDDDSLDLFKKTLPSASFMQVQVSSQSVIQAARKALRPHRDHRLDLISMALHGRKVSFAKVTGMIDEMVALLQKEQGEDESKKVYCLKEFDDTEDEKKALDRSIGKLQAEIADNKGDLETLTEDIANLRKSIQDLDKEVAEATEIRKKENVEYKDAMAADNAAIEIIGIAKNRMNKFYNPRLYKAAPKVELGAEERIAVSMGGTATPTPAPGGIAGTGVTVLVQGSVAPDAAPETWGAGYSKSSEQSTGAIAMMDLLVKDLTKDVTERETTEKDSQADYEMFMKDSAEMRAQESKTLSEKVGVKADTEVSLSKAKEERKSKKAELMANEKYNMGLHQECDWLIQNFDTRKEARSAEIDSLKNAKAVLAGASYS